MILGRLASILTSPGDSSRTSVAPGTQASTRQNGGKCMPY